MSRSTKVIRFLDAENTFGERGPIGCCGEVEVLKLAQWSEMRQFQFFDVVVVKKQGDRVCRYVCRKSGDSFVVAVNSLFRTRAGFRTTALNQFNRP